MSIAALIKPHLQGQVEFEYYRDGQLWYRSAAGFLFPVPVTDIGNATFLARDKATLFMRYIRKWVEVREAKDNESQ